MPASSTLEDMLRRNAPGSGAFAGPSFTGPSFTGPQAVQPPEFAGPSYTAPTLEIPPFPGQPRPADAGAPLPVGAPVAGGLPGQYESVRTTPQMNDPLAASATAKPSRFTLVQTNPIAARGPQAGTSAGANFRGTATMQALAQIYGAGAPAPLGQDTGRAGPGGFTPPDTATPAQTAGYLAEQNRLNLATNDEVRRLAPNMPQAGQTPEVRANNQRYLDKLLRAGPGGGDPAQLAAGYRQAALTARDPRLVTLGQDEAGNPITGTADRNGNFSRIAPAKKPMAAQPEYSADGAFYRSGPDDEWKPAPRSGEKPLNPTEWILAGRPEGNYQAYRKGVDEATRSAPKPTAPAAAPGAKPAAPAYRSADVQAELKRRGLAN